MDATEPDRQKGLAVTVACPVGRDLRADLIDLSETCFELAAGARPSTQERLRRIGRQIVWLAGQEGRHC